MIDKGTEPKRIGFSAMSIRVVSAPDGSNRADTEKREDFVRDYTSPKLESLVLSHRPKDPLPFS